MSEVKIEPCKPGAYGVEFSRLVVKDDGTAVVRFWCPALQRDFECSFQSCPVPVDMLEVHDG